MVIGILITLIAGFLRTYRISETLMFLADQGRDALVLKRLITFEHLPALGATTSVGQVFLGPFYYYFVAPWLPIFQFDPVGPAFGVAVTSTIGIFILFLIVKKEVGIIPAIIASILFGFSSTLISFARFSWNPNLLPFFSLLVTYSFYKMLQKPSALASFCFGMFLACSVQLHYFALFIIPGTLFLYILKMISIRLNRSSLFLYIRNMIISIGTFFVFFAPLILFDLKHNFLNLRGLVKIFSSENPVGGNRLSNLISAFSALNKTLLSFELSTQTLWLLIILIVVSMIILLIRSQTRFQFSTICVVLFTSAFSGLALYMGPKHAHYFGMVYPLYILLIALAYKAIPFRFFRLGIAILFISVFLILNIKQYPGLINGTSGQVKHARTVAEFLNKVIPSSESFNFAVQPDGWQEDSYLYFLELSGKRPVDRAKIEVGKNLFVVCGNPCNILTNKSWNITMFGKSSLVHSWKVDGVDIYQLKHAP